MDFGSMSRLSLKELFRLSESLGFLAVAGYPLPPAVKNHPQKWGFKMFSPANIYSKGERR